MGKLQIEDRRQQEEIVEDPKKEESPLALPPPQQVQEFSKCMHSEFEMSMMGELNFFLGLQIKQLKEGTFINQAKYIRDLLKRFNMEEAKTMKTPMSSSIKLDNDEKGFWLDFILSRLDSASFPCVFSIFSVLWMAPRERRAPLGLRASALLSHLSLSGRRLAERRGRSINFSQLQHFGFEGLFSRMGWLPIVTISEPIFSTLVRAFYSWVTYELGGLVMSTVRGVEIRLSPESICLILDIPSVGLWVYEAKAWPIVPIFEPRKAIQRLCGLADAQGVSYLEAFIVDSILTGRRIHVGFLMMMHMISCVESTTKVLPYGHFLTRVFKNAGVDLSREMNFEAPTSYDTYDEQSLGRMKFEQALDGSWIRRVERPLAQARGQRQMHPGVEEEAEIKEMEDGLDP
ncbi:hypothetical protein CK203_116660 [Vitis vinifera]|uniref:Uncharacterized protein n=1 Tax=Vitis vinifera TaxID=29760 RepID=A0A438DMN2_VITVI|nr:hypothetical protein CK203_116660 [Vitis vinifera]